MTRTAHLHQGSSEPSRALELGTFAMVQQHDAEMKAYLRGEVGANAWRPEKYAEAVIREIETEFSLVPKVAPEGGTRWLLDEERGR